MDEKRFSNKEAIKFGWKVATENILLVATILTAGGVSFFFEILMRMFRKSERILFYAIYLVSALIQGAFTMGQIKIALGFADNKQSRYKDLFSCFHLLLKYIIASTLYTLIVVLGFILFIIPGIIWGIKYQFYIHFMVDKEVGPIEALKLSSRATYGAKSELLVFGFVLSLINIAGVLCCGIGLLVTLPLTLVAWTYVYRILERQLETPEAPPSYPQEQIPTQDQSSV